MPSLVEKVNHDIRAFVEARPRLKPGTGCYSTPFRGTLFGLERARDVEAQLASRGVQLLLLGSNPNIRRSLDMIAAGYQRLGDWDTFLAQQESGLFGEMDPDAPSAPRTGWSPLGAKAGSHWRFFKQAIIDAGVAEDAVAVQNVVPWGSASINDLLEGLSADQPLLQDMLRFSSELLMTTIRALRPQVILAPLSLCRNDGVEQLVNLPIASSCCEGRACDEHGVLRKGFRIELGRFEGRLPIIFTSHPSALMYQDRGSRDSIRHLLLQVLAEALDAPSERWV